MFTQASYSSLNISVSQKTFSTLSKYMCQILIVNFMTRWTFPKLHPLKQHKLKTRLPHAGRLVRTTCADRVFQSRRPRNDTAASEAVHLNRNRPSGPPPCLKEGVFIKHGSGLFGNFSSLISQIWAPRPNAD